MANSKPQSPAPQTQVRLIDDNEYKLNIYDYTIVPAFSLAAAIWTFFHIWTAVNWDDLLYMGLSRHTVGHPWILNRYGHIYLQKLFFTLAGDSINGGRVFWCFLIFGTVVLTYFCCRLLFGKKGYICGIVAGLMVLMQHDFGKDAGCTLADFTVMFLVTLGMFVYLTYLRHHGKWRRWLLLALGLIFFWAVKSKEVGVCFGVVFLGLLWDDQGRFSVSGFFNEIRWVIAGMAAGCLLLMLLDMVFIGDMFFSIRPSNIAKVFNTNVHQPSARALSIRISMSWLSFMAMRALFVVFIFYMLAGWKSPFSDFSTREKVIWLFPFVLIFFLTFIRTGFIIVPRYISSAVPVMSIWASSCFWFDMGSFKSDEKLLGRFPKARVMWSLAVVALIAALVIVSKQHDWALYYKFDNPVKGAFDLKYNKLTLPEEILYVLVLMPLFVTVALIASFFGKKRAAVTMFVSWTCMFVLILCPLSFNVMKLNPGKNVKYMSNVQKSRLRFEPFRIFKEDLKLTKGDKVLISKDIHQRSWMLGRSRHNAQCNMLNIYFNEHFDYDQVIDGEVQDILKADYDYAIVTASILKQVQTTSQQGFIDIVRRYDIVKKPEAYLQTRSGPMQLLLLKKKS